MKLLPCASSLFWTTKDYNIVDQAHTNCLLMQEKSKRCQHCLLDGYKSHVRIGVVPAHTISSIMEHGVIELRRSLGK